MFRVRVKKMIATILLLLICVLETQSVSASVSDIKVSHPTDSDLKFEKVSSGKKLKGEWDHSITGAVDGATDLVELFWAPLRDVPIVFDAVGDWSVVYYSRSNKMFYITRVDNAKVNVDTGTFSRLVTLFKEFKITSIFSLRSATDNNKVFYNWVQACPGYGESTMGYITGSKHHLKYELEFSKDYKELMYRYETIFDEIETLAGGITSKSDSQTFATLDALLRITGNQVSEDTAQITGNVVNGKSMTWFKTAALSEDRVSLVLTRRGEDIEVGYKYTQDNQNQSGTFSNLKVILESVSGWGMDLTQYPTLKALSDSYKKAKDEIAETVKDNNNDQANQTTQIKDEEFNRKTAFEKWTTVVINYINSDGTQQSLTGLSKSYQDIYNIKKFGGFIKANTSKGSPEGKDSLTEEEILRIKAYFYLAATKADKTVSIPTDFAYPSDIGKDFVTVSGDDPIIEPVEARGTIKSDLAGLPVNEGNASMLSVATKFNYIVKYLLLKNYGYTSSTVASDGDQQSFEESTYLKSIIPDAEETLGLLYYPYSLTRMENVKHINNTSSSIEAYRQLQYMLMVIATYAENSAGIEAVTSKGATIYKCTALDDFKAQADPDPANAVMTEEQKAMIAAFIGIHEGLEYLGVKPFTPKLKYIYNCYEGLLSYKESTQLQDYVLSDKTEEPMRAFFDLENKKLSYFYNIGVAASATYIPMQTNLYSASSISAVSDTGFVEQFHYPFGFYRKVLYIDTNASAAVDMYVTEKKGSKRIATLNDMLQPEKDIVLYLDDNFYNIDKLSEMQGYTYNRLANTEGASKGGSETSSVPAYLADLWGEWADTSVENVCKTGAVDVYSNNIKRKGSEYGASKVKGTDYLLSDSSIDKYLTGYTSDKDKYDVYDEYTPMQSFAVVSAIYRQSPLYSLCTKQSREQNPVFVSSSNLAKITNVKQEEFNTLFNYMMLKNMKGNMGIDYRTTLDLDSPIYMDIYGNIITESGLVVIPAASNPTLYKAESYDICTTGFVSLYNNGIYRLSSTYKNSNKYMGDFFEVDETTGYWEMKAIDRDTIYMNLADLPISDVGVLNTFMELMQEKLNASCLEYNSTVWRITEVMRGAPIENIDKEFEGIKGVQNISKYGIASAYKLEELADAVLSGSDGNSMLTLPNPAYMEGVEYVVLFGIKIIFAFSIVLIFYKVYKDSILGVLGLKTLYRFAVTIILFSVIIMGVPKLMNLSYYQVNKRLLQDEATYIALLNLEKRSDGREIGITSVEEPQTNSTMYIKVDDVTVPWYEVIDDILTSSTFATMQSVYDKAFDSSALAELPGIIKKTNGLYMDASYLFDTTSVEYDAENNILYNTVKETPYVSFVTPYYAILDLLLSRVNEYNKENEVNAFATKVQNQGAVRAVGVSRHYLTSNYFMEGSQDVLGLKGIYGIDSTLIESALFSEEQYDQMRASFWYQENLSDDEVIERIKKLDNKARVFVANNRDLLGKVTDETFLKVMALSLALSHNEIFDISSARDLEIFNIDTRDLIRVSIANRGITMEDASKSFARFVYDNGGTFGVIMVAFLICIYWVASVAKPLCTAIIIACMVSALVIRKLLKRDEDQAVEGFAISLALLCLINVIYALTLKFTILVPYFTGTIAKAATTQIVVQVIYFLLLSILTMWVVKDWSNLGFNKFVTAAYRVGSAARDIKHYHPDMGRKHRSKSETGHTIYEKMCRRDERRNGARVVEPDDYYTRREESDKENSEEQKTGYSAAHDYK